GLFQSFSRLSLNPSDTTARQSVIDQANRVAEAFHNVVSGVAASGQNVDQQTRGSISEINRIAATISHINAQQTTDPQGGTDAGLDAQLNSSLEELAQHVDFTALQQPNGKINVYLGGQTPLVLGEGSFAIQG